MFFDDGEMFPMMNVKVFPVRDYCNSLVSLDYRNDAMDLCLEDNEAMTLPRVVRDWLMFFSYCR